MTGALEVGYNYQRLRQRKCKVLVWLNRPMALERPKYHQSQCRVICSLLVREDFARKNRDCSAVNTISAFQLQNLAVIINMGP